MSGNEITLGVRLTADGKSLIGEVKQSQDAIDKLGQSTRNAAADAEKLSNVQKFQSQWFNQTAKSMREQSVALAETSSSVNKLLDRYDPLSAKLRQLQNDFKALDQAASSGKIAGRDDSRLDSVYAKLQHEISATQAAMSGVGSAAQAGFDKVAAGAEKSMFATVGARRELMVLGHEAISGNFSRMPGSMMVLAERTDLSMASLLGLGGAVLTVAAGAGVLAYAMHAGAEELHAMNRALALTSDFAGLTRGGLRSLSEEISNSSQLTIGQSKEVVTQLAASGKIGAEAFGKVAGLVAVYAQATGESAAEATPKIIKMFSDPTKGAEELNRTLHALAPLEMERIATLQRTGHEVEAQIVLADAYRKELEKHKEPIGAMESAWNSTKKAASEAWDAMLGVGREKTLEEKLKEQQSLLKRYSAELAAGVNVPQAREGANKAQSAIDGFGSEKAVADGIAAANAILARKNARDQDTLSIAHANSKLYRMQTIQENIDKLQSDGAKRSTANNAQEEKFRLDSITRLQQQLTEQPKDTTAYSNAVAARIKSEADLAYTLQDAAGKSQLALLDMQFKARVLAETDYLEQKQAIEQQGADAALKRITDQMAAEKDAYDKSGKPEDRERHLANLNKLIGELGKAAQHSADVGLSEMYRILGETNKYYEEARKSVDALGKTEISALEKALAAQKLHNAEIGKTAEQKELERAAIENLDTARLQDEENALRFAAEEVDMGQEFKDIYTRRANDLKKVIALRKEFANGLVNNAEKEKNAAAAKQYAEEWKKANEEISRSLSDGLMRAFESGKSVASAFKDTLVNMFKTLVLKPVISFIVSPISGAITAAMSGAGFSGAANAGQSAGGIGGWLNAGSTLESGYEAITGGFSSGYSSFATSSVGQSMGLGTPASYTSSIPELGYTGTETASAVSELGATVGTALSYVGAGLAGIAVGSAIAGDKKVIGIDGTSASAIGAAIGGVVFGPIGALLGGIAGGVFNAAFGMGNKESGATTLSGNFSQSGFAGAYQTPWHQDGGWFRSDKNGTESTAVSAAQSSAFQTLMAGTESVFQKLVTVSGDATRSVTGWTFAINRQLNTEEQQKQLMVDIANSMGAYLIPVLSKFQTKGENLADTAVRLSDEFILTSKLAGLLGQDVRIAFGWVGIASIEARDNLVQLMGGIQQMTATTQSYYANFFSDSERHANDLKALGQQFAAIGAVMPATREGFRAMVEGENLNTEAGRQMVASLLSLNGAFAAVVPATESAATANQNYGLQTQLLQAQGNTATLRARELALLDASNQPLQQQIWALQDKKVADAAAASAASQAASAASQAADAQIQAANQIKSAWQGVTDSVFDEVQRIRGLMGGDSAASLAQAQAKFTITTAQARAGDQDAAKLLPQLSQSLLTLVEDNATSLVELRRIQGQTAGSLDTTGNILASKYGLKLPGFAVGINSVPYDMIAQIHQDERILPAADNRELMFRLSKPPSGQSNAEVVAELRAVRLELEHVRRQLDEANFIGRRTADATNGRPENPMQVEVVT